ncbi:MAG: Dabb family protein [Planctomycetota bacterium]|nr:MAG: Dabb family protein [Planctomycetota bacterium]
MHRFSLALILLCAVAGGGCQATRPARPSLISHVVFFELADPRDSTELISDCDALLTDIDSVETYACGRHIDTGRATVLTDYDVGLIVGFASKDAYAAYVEHPLHVRLVEKWKPRLEALRVYDIYDPTQ